ncbi:MAG TPA: hypothetical protein VIJ51_07875 [Solirubrobacteraceae bacterium]
MLRPACRNPRADRGGRRPRGPRAATLSVIGLMVSVAATASAGALGAGTSGPTFTAPRKVMASTPNVPSAVSGVGEALTLRPGSGPGPALQLASAHGRIRTIQLATMVAGLADPSVAIGNSGVLAATWDTSGAAGSTPDVLEVAVGTFAAPPTSATVLSPAGATVSGEQAFVTAAGTAIVIWTETDADGLATVRAAVVPPGGTPTPITIDADDSYVGAGLGADGGLVVIEQDNGAFIERTIAANGSVGPSTEFTAPVALSEAASGSLDVLVDAAGDQLYSWRPPGSARDLYAVWRSAAGVFGPIQALGGTADVGGDGPVVALNTSGHAVAVLTPRRTGPLTVRFASRLSHFGPAERIGAAGRYADMPVVSIDRADRTLLAWVDSPASSRGTTKSRALVAEARGTRFTTPKALPVEKGLGQMYLGDAPLTTADPGGTPELVTYAASKGSSPVGQIAFLTG